MFLKTLIKCTFAIMAGQSFTLKYILNNLRYVDVLTNILCKALDYNLFYDFNVNVISQYI